MRTKLILTAVLLCALFIGNADAWRRRRRSPQPQPPPNTPPTLRNCPGNLGNQYTTTSTKRVSWTEPTCSDSQSSCTVSRSGPAPGSYFSEGSHTIGYTARDTAGLTSSCSFSFTVVVIRCGAVPSPPPHCTVSCTQSTSVGSTCTYTCSAGLTLSGSSQRVCVSQSGNTAAWSGSSTTCTDTHAPTIGYCPAAISVDRTEYWGVEVTFTIPTATDTFDQSLDAWTVPSDLTSPYTFTSNTTCEYHFRDDAGNAATCYFPVAVNDIVVPEFLFCPPSKTIRTSAEMTSVTWDEPTYQDIVGDDVQMTCNYGGNSVLMPWGDNRVIYTATNLRNGLRDTCEFVMTVEPIPCFSLRTPAHGAISCDTWAYGRYCSMSCNKDYDIPVPSAFQPATDVFTCGTSGQWNPHGNVPDCSQIHDQSKSQLPTDLLYYSGQCGSPTTLNAIAQSFIETIDKSVHSDICNGNDDCNVGNVVVRCGWPTRRRRRRNTIVGKRRQRREESNEFDTVTEEGLINLDDILRVDDSSLTEMHISLTLGINLTPADDGTRARQKLRDMADRVLDVFTSGDEALTPFRSLVGMDDDASTFLVLGDHTIECPKGYIANNEKAHCVACTTGHYYDADSNSCRECGYGFFQDGYAQMECTPCPEGLSTRSKGSREPSDCEDQCEAGHFSTSGFSPCIKCPLDTFQPLIGQTQCFECPDGTRTRERGETEEKNCVNF